MTTSSSAAAPESAAARRVIAALSLTVVAAVGLVLYAIPRPAVSPAASGGPDGLATLNAGLNAAATCFLLAGFVFVKRRQLELHRFCMLTAFGLSSVFLVTYLLHHATVGSVRYAGAGILRAVYFAVLVPHVLLAGAIVPLALVTLRRGLRLDVANHRRIARITLPLWLYVSASGVLLYFMLYY